MSEREMGDFTCAVHQHRANYRCCSDAVETPRGNERAEKAEAQLARLREALEELFPHTEGFTEDFDVLVARGLLVEVPADEDFKAEWDTDTMYVWSWSPLAAHPGGQ